MSYRLRRHLLQQGEDLSHINIGLNIVRHVCVDSTKKVKNNSQLFTYSIKKSKIEHLIQLIGVQIFQTGWL